MRLHYFGSQLNEVFRASELIRETFWGLGGNDTFYFHHGLLTPTFPNADFSDRFIGGAGNDVVRGLYVGLNGYDTHNLLSFDGGDGYDTIRYNVSDTLPAAETAVMDLGRFTTLSRSVEHHMFDIDLKADTPTLGHLTINGTRTDETVRLEVLRTMAETPSVVGIAVNLAGGDDTFEYVGTPLINTRLAIRTGSGNDTVKINDTNSVNSNTKGSVIKTEGGNDLVVLSGMHKETVHLGGHDDTIYLLTGGFAEKPDVVFTGRGRDRIYMELDEYSKLARIRDFDPANDLIVFDKAEFRDTTVTFDRAVWETAPQPKLYMDNASGKLWFGDNVMANLTNGAVLTAANFITDDFLF
jgi:hypothetical protein